MAQESIGISGIALRFGAALATGWVAFVNATARSIGLVGALLWAALFDAR